MSREPPNPSRRVGAVARARARFRTLALIVMGLAFALLTTLTLAEPRVRSTPTPNYKRTSAGRPPAPKHGGGGNKTDGGTATTATPGSEGRATAELPPDASAGAVSDAGVVEAKTSDGGARVFRFGELEIEGRLKSPQLIYFMRRVRAEFAAEDLGHRSFMRELSETRKEPSF